jgi:hypothetical protein
MENKNKEYEVGYKRPPVKNQFKTGQSGNPKGRPKLVQDFPTDFQDELEEVINIQEGGKSKPITKQRALIKRLIANALNGNASAIKLVTMVLSKMPVKVDDIEKDLSLDDAKILEEFIKRRTNNEQ